MHKQSMLAAIHIFVNKLYVWHKYVSFFKAKRLRQACSAIDRPWVRMGSGVPIHMKMSPNAFRIYDEYTVLALGESIILPLLLIPSWALPFAHCWLLRLPLALFALSLVAVLCRGWEITYQQNHFTPFRTQEGTKMNMLHFIYIN